MSTVATCHQRGYGACVPRPHRLASLHAADPERARAELKSLLDRKRGNVSAAARELSLHYVTVRRWVSAWGLADWLEQRWPALERIGAAARNRSGLDRLHVQS